MISVTVDYSILFYECADRHNPWPTDTVEVMMRVGCFDCWQEARPVGTHVPPAHADITFPVRQNGLLVVAADACPHSRFQVTVTVMIIEV